MVNKSTGGSLAPRNRGTLPGLCVRRLSFRESFLGCWSREFHFVRPDLDGLVGSQVASLSLLRSFGEASEEV